jgi:hypothetical protein
MKIEIIEMLGCIGVFATILAAIALIFAAFFSLRGQWKFFWENTIILTLLVADALFSLCVFNYQILKITGPIVPLDYCPSDL